MSYFFQVWCEVDSLLPLIWLLFYKITFLVSIHSVFTDILFIFNVIHASCSSNHCPVSVHPFSLHFLRLNTRRYLIRLVLLTHYFTSSHLFSRSRSLSFSPLCPPSCRFFRSSLRETLSMARPCWRCRISQVCPHVPALPPSSTASSWVRPPWTWSALQDLAVMPALQGFLFTRPGPGASTGARRRALAPRAPRGRPLT